MIHLPTVHVCTKFQSSRLHSSWEKCDKKFSFERLRKQKFLLEREKKTNKGADKQLEADSLLQVIPNICKKFQNPRRSSSWEIFDTNFPMYYTGVRDGQKEKWKKKAKKAKINHSILIFFPTIYLAPLKVYTKFEDSGSHRSRDFCDRNFIGEKNGQIKGLISRRLILFYTIQQFIPNICTKFQNPKCSSSWEIFDEKKSLHTHNYWNDKNYIPHIYFVYRGSGLQKTDILPVQTDF